MSSLRPGPMFDVLKTTADQLCKRLNQGSINSVQIVEVYLDQIQRHNTQGAKCRAVISTPPRIKLISWAAKLDQERRQGSFRGPLHGIPILLKDNFATDVCLGMPTTAGSYALFDACPSGNCDIVDNVLSSLELLGNKGRAGWSAVGGMCQPAYIPTGYDLADKRKGESGSSTGSAVGVACGFAPLALGHETTGSMVSPSAVAVGAMGKSAIDVALACDALSASKKLPSLTSQVELADLSEMTIGFLDIEKWRLPDEVQDPDPVYYSETAKEYRLAKQCLKRNGASIVEIHVEQPGNLRVGDIDIGELMYNIINQEAKSGIDRFLRSFEFSKVRTLNDVVKFNDEHADVEFDKDYCPDQDKLLSLIETSRPREDQTARLETCRNWAAAAGIDKAVIQHDVDVVVCSSDSFFAAISVAARYPMSTMPSSFVSSSGRPYGLQAIAQANEEGKLVKFMAAWESIRPQRQPPDLEACEKARASW